MKAHESDGEPVREFWRGPTRVLVYVARDCEPIDIDAWLDRYVEIVIAEMAQESAL